MGNKTYVKVYKTYVKVYKTYVKVYNSDLIHQLMTMKSIDQILKSFEEIDVQMAVTATCICIYIRSNINYKIRHNLPSEILENLVVEIKKPRSKSILVSTWYRSPDLPNSYFAEFD